MRLRRGRMRAVERASSEIMREGVASPGRWMVMLPSLKTQTQRRRQIGRTEETARFQIQPSRSAVVGCGGAAAMAASQAPLQRLSVVRSPSSEPKLDGMNACIRRPLLTRMRIVTTNDFTASRGSSVWRVPPGPVHRALRAEVRHPHLVRHLPCHRRANMHAQDQEVCSFPERCFISRACNLELAVDVPRRQPLQQVAARVLQPEGLPYKEGLPAKARCEAFTPRSRGTSHGRRACRRCRPSLYGRSP